MFIKQIRLCKSNKKARINNKNQKKDNPEKIVTKFKLKMIRMRNNKEDKNKVKKINKKVKNLKNKRKRNKGNKRDQNKKKLRKK